MTWVLWAWVTLTVLFIVLINTVPNEDELLADCRTNSASTAEQAGCELGTEIAAGVWTAVGVVVGFMGFIVLALIWFMTRPKEPEIVYVQAPAAWPPPPPPT